MVEVNCQSDFAAKTPSFVSFATEIAKVGVRHLNSLAEESLKKGHVALLSGTSVASLSPEGVESEVTSKSQNLSSFAISLESFAISDLNRVMVSATQFGVVGKSEGDKMSGEWYYANIHLIKSMHFPTLHSSFFFRPFYFFLIFFLFFLFFSFLFFFHFSFLISHSYFSFLFLFPHADKGKALLVLYEASVHPPHFEVVMRTRTSSDTIPVASGKQNVFVALVLFVYLLRQHFAGYIGHVSLSDPGIRLTAVVG